MAFMRHQLPILKSGSGLASTLALTLLAVQPLLGQPTARPVSVRFAATAHGTPVRCGAPFDGIGITGSRVSIADLRFYVSHLRLVTATGVEAPITLNQDGLWQVDDVALLDFEDGSSGCANGTEPTRDVVQGTIPEGDYLGVRFELGLSFDKNHREPTLQPSPLNLSRLFWSWNGGYKFMRMDLRTTGQPKGWMLHLGSTGCLPGETPTTVPDSCAHGNLVTVNLPAYSDATDVIELDVSSLLARSDVDVNTDKTPFGCMSGQTDPECGPIFEQLGLAFGENPGGPQKVFRVRKIGTAAP